MLVSGAGKPYDNKQVRYMKNTNKVPYLITDSLVNYIELLVHISTFRINLSIKLLYNSYNTNLWH